MMQEDNRRAHPRIEYHGRCWCESGRTTIYAQLMNVSEGGVFVRTFAPLEKGTRTRIRWSVDAGEVEADAVVVWTRGRSDGENPPGMGLRFERIDEDGRARVDQIITRDDS